MSIVYLVTPEILSKFKEPFGTLVTGTPKETIKTLNEILQKEQPPQIIAVGDTVSRNLNKHHISTQLSVTDNKSRRRRIRPQIFPDKTLVKIKNPRGTITQEAITAIQKAISSENKVNLFVDGEEDLLTLIAVRYAPENAFVIYGQPHKGLVIVKVTPQKRAEAQKILSELKTVKKETPTP